MGVAREKNERGHCESSPELRDMARNKRHWDTRHVRAAWPGRSGDMGIGRPMAMGPFGAPSR